jgi:opacity protein-like surface antigen
MGKRIALIFAAAVAIGTSPAIAADLLPPLPPVEAPFLPAGDFSGWYLRGDVGVGLTQLNDMRSTFAPGSFVPGFAIDRARIEDTVNFGVGAGYQWNNWVRFDVTGEYRAGGKFSALESYSNLFGLACGARCYDGYSAHLRTGVFLANAYFDLGTWYGITPFVGGGVGVAYHNFRDLSDVSLQPAGGFGTALDKTQTNLAWAAMAGIAYTVNPHLKLEMGYRYLNMGTIKGNQIVCQGVPGGCPLEQQTFKVSSHDFRLGMRWMFNDLPPPPPPPLVRKY